MADSKSGQRTKRTSVDSSEFRGARAHHSAASLAPLFLGFPIFASTGARNLPV